MKSKRMFIAKAVSCCMAFALSISSFSTCILANEISANTLPCIDENVNLEESYAETFDNSAEDMEIDFRNSSVLSKYLTDYDSYYSFDYDSVKDLVLDEIPEISTEENVKKVLIIGDSLSAGYRSAYHPEWGELTPYTYYLAQKPGLQIVRKAFGGATLSTETIWQNPFSLTRETDFSYFDVIIFFMGTNDWDVHTPMGDLDSRNTGEFCGSFNAIMDQLLPSGAKVYGVTPLPRIERFDGRVNWQELTTTDYANAFKILCQRRGIPIIDCQTEFNINALNYMSLYADFVHPKDNLSHMLADYIYTYLEGGNGNEQAVRGFVERLYNICLSRSSDSDGINYWTNLLLTQQKTGSEVAEGFFFSDEFKQHNYDDEQFLTLLYRTMMGREPDTGGMEYWKNILNSGVSRKYIYRGFCESKEFTNICKDYGIIRGGVTLTESRDYCQEGTALLSRMYTKALGRSYDADGLNYWSEKLWSGRFNIDDVTTNGFLHSQEFTNKNLSNEDYTKVLYRTYLDREYDEGGLAYWLNNLNTGYTRDQVMYGFSNSAEFSKTKRVYQLVDGY